MRSRSGCTPQSFGSSRHDVGSRGLRILVILEMKLAEGIFVQ
jgi:hypothetical protein